MIMHFDLEALSNRLLNSIINQYPLSGQLAIAENFIKLAAKLKEENDDLGDRLKKINELSYSPRKEINDELILEIRNLANLSDAETNEKEKVDFGKIIIQVKADKDLIKGNIELLSGELCDLAIEINDCVQLLKHSYFDFEVDEEHQ